MSNKKQQLFGIHAVEHFFNKTPENILAAWMLDGQTSNALRKLKQQFEQQGITVQLVARHAMDKMVRGRHQGVIIETRAPAHDMTMQLGTFLEKNKDSNFLYLVLDSVQDPHNLGACIRTAVAAGVSAVIVPKDRSAGITDTVRKVASGAVEEITVITVVNLVRAMRELKEAGVWLVGTAADAEQSIYDIDMTSATALVMGGEEKGLRAGVAKECDFLASIPLIGEIESLNVSVATGIVLYEAVRQRNQ